jgi:hypothetical protein
MQRRQDGWPSSQDANNSPDQAVSDQGPRAELEAPVGMQAGTGCCAAHSARRKTARCVWGLYAVQPSKTRDTPGKAGWRAFRRHAI